MKKKKIPDIRCEQAVARFNDFMDNYLKGKARDELLGHLYACKDCMDRLEFEQLLKSKVHQILHSDDAAVRARIEKLIAALD